MQIPGYTSVLSGSGNYINQIVRTGNAGLPTVFNASAAGVWQAGINQGKYPLSILTETDIRALGNAIRHEYDTIDPEIIWHIVQNDLLPLADAVKAAIRKLE